MIEDALDDLPLYHYMGLLGADEIDGWALYRDKIEELGLLPYLGAELKIVAFDPLYGLYYLCLNNNRCEGDR